jgi:lipopolysaccharide transport system permease protein
MTIGTEPARATLRKVRLTPGSGRLDATLRELFEFRELLAVFTWRLVAVQYKQSILGLGWAVINPLVTTIVFSVVFGVLAAIPSDGKPYPLFVLSGLILWQYFTRAVSAGSASLVANAGIITKVYFPRLILPLSTVLAALLDLAVASLLLLAMMLYYGMAPTLTVLFFPAFVLMTLALAMGVCLFLSAANALYRDVGFVVPFLLQIWMYLTPVIYPIHLVPETWRWVLYLNPMTAFVEGARWSILGSTAPSAAALAIGCGVTIISLSVGLVLFRKMEALFVDRI